MKYLDAIEDETTALITMHICTTVYARLYGMGAGIKAWTMMAEVFNQRINYYEKYNLGREKRIRARA